MKSIDLGVKMGDSHVQPMKEGEDKDKKYYPSTFINSDKDLNLPKKGRITFEFVKNAETIRRDRKDDGDSKYSCDLELLKIVDVSETSDESAEDVDEKTFDDAADEVRNKKDEESDSDSDY